jgi:cob(I)alamin adenosyltransferase
MRSPEEGTMNDEKSQDEINERHADKMRKKKAARDKILAAKTIEKGLIIVHTGKGKGKSTAAFGMVFRALGHGFRIVVIQFVKGSWETGERAVLERYPDLVTIKAMGEGFTWETQDRGRDIELAEAAWEAAKAAILDPQVKMVLLDEINIALRYNYLDVDEVAAFLKSQKPDDTHVILTGRNAKDELIEIADLVTEMTQIKHPFRSGVKAQVGIEY